MFAASERVHVGACEGNSKDKGKGLHTCMGALGLALGVCMGEAGIPRHRCRTLMGVIGI